MADPTGVHGCATAVAHPNIALAKYWGKLDAGRNLPAVPSISVTLDGMCTTTTVTLDPALAVDQLWLDGAPADARATARVTRMLDLVAPPGTRGGTARLRAHVESRNDFPTAAGLASSASAFAALAVAADAALGAGRPTATLSDMARQVSASAGRSLYGGFVELPAGDPAEATLAARPLAPADHWALRVLVAVTAVGPKAIGSTEGMNHTAATSPLYRAWVESAPATCDRVREALLARDLPALGAAVEHSALTMHATAIAADPGVLYWNPVTLAVIQAVRAMRSDGVPAYVTIDAGPHVKVLTTAEAAADVAARLEAVEGVRRTIVAAPGQGARVVPGPPRSEPGERARRSEVAG